jgi:hypothetical protein
MERALALLQNYSHRNVQLRRLRNTHMIEWFSLFVSQKAVWSSKVKTLREHFATLYL